MIQLLVIADSAAWPVWPLTRTGPTGQIKVLKIPIWLHHCVYLIETIKCICGMSSLESRRGSCGPGTNQLCAWPIWPVGPDGLTGACSQIRVRSCISTPYLYSLQLLLGQDLPTLYLWRVTVDWGEHNRIYQLHLLFYPLNNFSNLHASRLLISTNWDGVLGPAGRPRARRWRPHPDRVPPGQELRRSLLVCL
jgi:hypothetical protein